MVPRGHGRRSPWCDCSVSEGLRAGAGKSQQTPRGQPSRNRLETFKLQPLRGPRAVPAKERGARRARSPRAPYCGHGGRAKPQLSLGTPAAPSKERGDLQSSS